jgi:hypothetical protein
MSKPRKALDPVMIGGEAYETVAVGQTDQVIGSTGGVNDFLARIIVAVSTSATSTVTVKDGSTTILSIPANTPIGIYSIEIGVRSKEGAFSITTGAGASVLAVGDFKNLA